MEIIFYHLDKRYEYNFYNGSLIIKKLIINSFDNSKIFKNIPGSPFFPKYLWKDGRGSSDILNKKYLIIYYLASFYHLSDYDPNKYVMDVEIINLDEIEELKDKRLIASLLE